MRQSSSCVTRNVIWVTSTKVLVLPEILLLLKRSGRSEEQSKRRRASPEKIGSVAIPASALTKLTKSAKARIAPLETLV